MSKKIIIAICITFGLVYADDIDLNHQALRTFPANTIFATIQGINYPNIEIEEIPSNIVSGLLGMMLLSNKTMVMSPASVIRDKENINHVTQYIDELYKQPIAIQPDFQGRVWVIWQLTEREKKWVIDNKLNTWNQN